MNQSILNISAEYYVSIEPATDKPYALWHNMTFIAFCESLPHAKWLATEHAIEQEESSK